MRMPGRLHITWQDDSTLKIETDSGTQTRLLHFTAAPGQNIVAAPLGPAGAPDWQGFSVAQWDPGLQPDTGGVGFGIGLVRIGTRSRSLEVTTKNLRPGYLRKNGVPYSDSTSLTEYFELFNEPDGAQHLMVMTVVNDPVYSRRSLRDDVGFQEGTGRVEMGSDAVHGQVRTEGSERIEDLRI